MFTDLRPEFNCAERWLGQVPIGARGHGTIRTAVPVARAMPPATSQIINPNRSECFFKICTEKGVGCGFPYFIITIADLQSGLQLPVFASIIQKAGCFMLNENNRYTGVSSATRNAVDSSNYFIGFIRSWARIKKPALNIDY